MIIRNETDKDFEKITKIHYVAFESYAEGIAVEQLRANNNLTISLVCENNGEVVGHIAYSPIYSAQKIIGLGLAPVGVLPEFQNQGIGSTLISEGNKLAFELGYKKIFVLGDPEFYSRFDFQLAKDLNYLCKFDLDRTHFMVLCDDTDVPIDEVFVSYCKEFDNA